MSVVLRPVAGRSLLLAAAAALAAFSVGATDADASAERSGPDAVRIAAPVTDGLVTTDQVRVKLKTAPVITGVRVFAGPKDVSSHFARRGRVWTGTLPRSLFKAGANRLLVHGFAGRRSAGTDAHSFILSRDAAVQTTVRSGAAAEARMSAGPAATKSYVPTPGTLPVSVHTATPSAARLTVNGHRVADLRATRFLDDHSYRVSSVDGLRAGANRVVLSTYDRSGRHTVKRWTIDRSAALPLAEAGSRERVTHKGDRTQLDATASRPTAKGASLRYRWRVVSAPAGAKPVLQGAMTAKPSFKPDVPGVYQVALTATHVNARGASAAAAAAVGTSSEDVATIDVAPALGAQGLYVSTDLVPSTNDESYNTMFIDGKPYTSTTQPGTTDVFVQFDETTLTPLRSGTDATITPAAGTVTVGVWNDTYVSDSSNPHGSAVWIGTAQVADNETPFPQPSEGNPASNLHGWVQPAPSRHQASWVGSDMLQVQTRAQGSTTTSNVMSVNGSTYTNSLPAGGQGGYQMLLLDNTGTPLHGAGTLYSTDGSEGSNDAMAAALATDLGNAVDAGMLTVVLQGFGWLPAIPDGSALSNALVSAGARADVINRLNDTTDTSGAYALISGLHTGDGANTQTRETSVERRGSGSLSALLVRAATDTYDDYIPFNSDNGPVDDAASNRYRLMPMLYAAPTTWDNWVRVHQTGPLRAPSAGETAALKYIVDYATNPDQNWVDLSAPCPAAPDKIRGYYCTTSSSNLDTLQEEEGRMTYDAADGAANGYSATDFKTAQNSLMWEALDAKGVRAAISDYQSMFIGASTSGTVDAAQIAGQITLTHTAGMSNSVSMLNVMSAVTGMASVIPDLGPAMTFTSGTLSLASDLLPNSSTQPDIFTSIEISADNAASELTAEYTSASVAMSRYGDYIVEDPAKLLALGELFKGPLDMGTDQKTHYQEAGVYAAKQFLWGTILAGSYAEWSAPGSARFSWNPKCSRDTGSWLHPFENMDDSGRWIGTKPGDSAPTTWWIAANDPHSPLDAMINNDSGLPPAKTDNLFAPIDPNGDPTQAAIGAVMPYFALDYLPFQTVPEWNTGTDTNGCDPGT